MPAMTMVLLVPVTLLLPVDTPAVWAVFTAGAETCRRDDPMPPVPSRWAQAGPDAEERDPGQGRYAGSSFAEGRPQLLRKPDRVVQVRKRAEGAKILVPRYEHQRESAGRDREAGQERQAPGDRGSPLRGAVSQRDGRPDVALRDVELAGRGRPLRSVTVLIQVPAGSGATLPGRTRLPAGP